LTRIQTTIVAGPSGDVFYFDGIDDYITQKVYANKVGAVTMATNTGGAMLIDAGLTGNGFRPYAGASGNTPYMVVATDTGGKVAWGYLGEEGTGETLGSELVTNGNMETGDPPTGWSTYGGTPVLDGVADERDGGSGIQSVEVQRDTSTAAMYRAQGSVTVGKLYFVSGWVKNVDATSVAIYLGSSGNLTVSTSVSGTSWTYVSFYHTLLSLSSVEIGVKVNGSSGDKGRFDDISVKEVLTPPATTGVKIYSTKNGTTQSWAGVETGFLPNSVASYEVRKSDFQITGAMTVGAWVKTNTIVQQSIMSKYSHLENKGFGLGIQDDGTVGFGVKKDIGSYYGVKTTATLLTNIWYHIIAVYNNDGSTPKIYINGELQNSTVWVASGNALNGFGDTSNPLVVTRNDIYTSLLHYLDGSIQSPFIYSRALSDAEIADLYNQVLRPI